MRSRAVSPPAAGPSSPRRSARKRCSPGPPTTRNTTGIAASQIHRPVTTASNTRHTLGAANRSPQNNHRAVAVEIRGIDAAARLPNGPGHHLRVPAREAAGQPAGRQVHAPVGWLPAHGLLALPWPATSGAAHSSQRKFGGSSCSWHWVSCASRSAISAPPASTGGRRSSSFAALSRKADASLSKNTEHFQLSSRTCPTAFARSTELSFATSRAR